ncbi:hypothetical protein D1AOALGA4SA_1807 [Olavius algarvensis Delta 1 endosymbiont]|nr:hypothetical protein D1AOALGA4SA_1807 [Olavius algarvensis Delta 1 endosymbiont]
MKSLYLKGLVFASLVCLLLAACGGGGGLNAGGGIDGTGIMSAGVVSAYGSIFVNGTEFDTSTAAIVVNGEEVGVGDDVVLDHLAIGMVVAVEGRILEDGRAVADRVTYSRNIAGPVESISIIDAVTKEVVVLGQTVLVNVITRYQPDTFGFDSIAVNDVMEVSGYLDDVGAVRATYVEKIGDTTTILDYEITGVVENLDNFQNTFMINDLTVDFAAIENRLPEGIPADDLFVEVEGALGAGGKLVADAIVLADSVSGDEGDEVEIMGYVTDVTSVGETIKFKVGRQEVHVPADPELAVYIDGLPADIVPGQKLEAEGTLEDGILTAAEIEFWEPDQIEVEGLVCCILSGSEFTVGDQAVQTDGDTVFEPEDLTIVEGIGLEVKGTPQDIDHGVVVADKISLEED